MSGPGEPVTVTVNDGISPNISSKLRQITVDATEAGDAVARLQAQLAGLDRASTQVTALAAATQTLASAQTQAATATVAHETALAGLQRMQAAAAASAKQLSTSVGSLRLESVGTQQAIRDVQGLDRTINSAAASMKVFAGSLGTQAALDVARELKPLPPLLNEVEHAAGKSGIQMGRLATEATVAGREIARGNFSRLAGTLTIAAQALGLLTPQVLLWGVAIVAATALALGFATAVDNDIVSSRRLQSELQGIGSVLGTTNKQFEDAALSGQRYGNMSVSASQALARAYLGTGKIGGQVLVDLTGYTQKYAIASGQTAKQAQGDLIKIFSDPTKGAEELSAKLGILTGDQYLEIQAMQRAGDVMGAQTVLVDALKVRMDALSGSVKEQTGFWEGVGIAISNAFHSIKVAMGGGSLAEQLAQAQSNLVRDQIGDAKTGLINESRVKEDRALVDSLTTALRRFNGENEKAHEQNAAKSAVMQGLTEAQSINPDLNVLPTLTAQYDKLNLSIAAARASGQTNSKAYRDVEDAYNRVHDAIGRVTDATGKYITQAERDHEVAVLKDQIVSTTDRTEKGRLTTQMRLLQTGSQLITNEEALTKATDAGNIVADKAVKTHMRFVDSAERHLTEARNLLAVQTDLNKRIEDGTITIAQANEETRTANALKAIEAERDNATGVLRARLTAVLKELVPLTHQLNAANDTTQQLKANDAQANANILLEKEIQLSGTSYLQRQLEIAQLKTLQELKAHGVTDPNSPEALAALSGAKANVFLQEAGRIGAEVNKLTDQFHDLTIQTAALNVEWHKGLISDQQYALGLSKVGAAALNLNIDLGKVDDAQSVLVAGVAKVIASYKGLIPELRDISGNLFTEFTDQFSSMIGQIATGAESLRDGLRSLAQTILSDLIGALVKLGIQWALQQTVGSALAAQATAASAVQAGLLQSLWYPAALLASIASFGGADEAGMLALQAAMAAGKVSNAVGALGFAEGGRVYGPGGPTEDRVPAWLSNGEFIVNAFSASRFMPLLEAINDNKLGSIQQHIARVANDNSMPRFAGGGFVSPSLNSMPSVGYGTPNIQLNNYGTPQVVERAEFSEGILRIWMRDEAAKVVSKDGPKMVENELNNPNSRPASALQKSYGLRPRRSRG